MISFCATSEDSARKVPNLRSIRRLGRRDATFAIVSDMFTSMIICTSRTFQGSLRVHLVKGFDVPDVKGL
ncbi:hypothetical protein T4D_15685 [Trichinella pseudospiralis]|uniref:Uncharacterized protein n=1 Tax=Trichinella pseudospiralis TaxID=6337 RepID=A0A0V1FCU8_TRIPS|nr:hypothetical protein T4D_15685 [Trichinella pseudospiralis]